MIRELKISELSILDNGILQKDTVLQEFKVNPFSHYIVYIDNNHKVIGYLYYSDIYNRIEINQFEIDFIHRNCGIGKKMLKFLTDSVDKSITLEVNVNNKSAIHLYKKFGFVKVAVRKGYYNGVDGILMERSEKMNDIYILGIESSCDETSVSIVKNGTEEISTIISSQIDIHKNYGGVVPEIASREHVKNITFVIEECLESANMKMEDMDAIAVTYGPGLIGSLLIGLEASKTLAYLYQKPLIPVHHIAGHIYANSLEKEMEFPLIALVVSGGHTELIKMGNHFQFEKLGGTLDDAVGECYDKVARVIGLEYPGGPKIDKLASMGKVTYSLPVPLKDNSYNFSFSGLKSAVINLNHKLKQRGEEIRKEDLAASFQNAAVNSLVSKTKKALEDYHVNRLIVAGGVAANKVLREAISQMCEEINVELTIPELKYCTDNGTMIAAAGYYAYRLGRRADLYLNSKSSDTLK